MSHDTKIARVRIQIDLEIDVPWSAWDASKDPEQELDHVRFFFEENHCVENETLTALEILKAAQDKANKDFHAEHPELSENAGVCVTCHAANVTLLSVKDPS